MAKKNQNPSKPASHLQTTHSYTNDSLMFSSGGLPSLSPTAEDAGVCVVCEDECTCGAAKTTVSIKKLAHNLSPTPLKANDENDSDDSPLSSVPPEAPPRPSGTSHSQSTQKKKRGRPSKADVLARQSHSTGRSTTRAGDLIFSEPSATLSKSKQPKPKSKPPTRGLSSATQKSRAKPSNRRVSQPFGSALSRTLLTGKDDDDDFSDHSGEFPTFLPASILGSDDSSSSSDPLSSDDLDSAIEAEEERLIVAEETLAMQKLRVRRELLGDNIPESGRRWDKMNWNNRERQASVDLQSRVDSDNNSESEEDEDDQDDADEDEDDIDLDAYTAPIHDWSEDEEEYDADVFFANLSDSSFGTSSSDSEHVASATHHNTMDVDIPSDLDALSLSEAADTGFSSNFGRHKTSQLPLVVTEDWDGHLVFAQGLRDGEGIGDASFDIAIRAVHEDEDMDTDDADAEETEDEDEAMEDSDSSGDDGNTTTEEDVGMDISPPIDDSVFKSRPPAIHSVDPLSTLSSPSGSPIALGQLANLPSRNDPHHSSASPKPSDILRQRSLVNSAKQNAWCSPPPGDPIASTSQSSETVKGTPKMGSFVLTTVEVSSSAVIDGSREVSIPSPFAYLKHRKSTWRGRKRRPNGLIEYFPRIRKRSRRSSLPDTTRPKDAETAVDHPSEASDHEHVQSSPELPPPKPIELGDVLNAALLGEQSDDADSDALADLFQSKRHIANLQRWDRVPIGTFRRLRGAGSFEIGALPPHPSSSTVVNSPRLADGFSYGSTTSADVTSPFANPLLGSALWENTLASPTNGRKGKRKGDLSTGEGSGGRKGRRKVLVSPVIFPVRDDMDAGQINADSTQFFSLSDKPASNEPQRRTKDKKATDLFDPALQTTPSKPLKRLTTALSPSKALPAPLLSET